MPAITSSRQPGQPLQAGDQLPDVTLPDETGAPVRLLDRTVGSTLILYFYPYDGSPGCTSQACALRDSWPLLRSSGVDVLGVNSAGADSHQRFRGRFGLPYSLLSDDDAALARAFGFVHLLPGLSGGWSRIERSTVIVDPGGRIRVVLRKVKANAHFDLLRVQLNLPDRVADDVASDDVHDDEADGEAEEASSAQA